ncbi:MAG: hypothetical protein HN842_02755 [Gammaproteobacteria bacterium]|jgi:predicted metal-dependent peptidase|nr:hypothetical protein [Gammaproteobacteria bacterium]
MNTMHINADRKIQLSSTGILLDHPFFGDLLAGLRKHPNRNIPTFRTDGEVIEYNPDFVDTLSIPHAKFILAHETLHVALTHHLRRGYRDAEDWNIAADHVVNLVLDDAGFHAPDDAVMHKSFSGKSAEEIYHIIHQEKQDGDGDGNHNSKGGGQGQNPSGGQSQPPDGDDQSDEQGNEPPPLSTGDFTDGTAKNEAERAQQEADWKVKTAQAAQAARSQGKLPGSLTELVDSILKPKANWKAQLRDFVSAISQDGYTMNPPNRRLRAIGINLPSKRSQSLGNIVIGVDTSASVSSDELEQFQGEINCILEEHPSAKATVMQCDWDLQSVDEYENHDLPIKMEVKGRRGTQFEPVFDEIERLGERPDCLIYLTDLGAEFPTPPDYPVLWASVYEGKAPWGDTIHII